MNDMDCNKNSFVYPSKLHRAMQNRYNIVANEQHDIHELHNDLFQWKRDRPERHSCKLF